MCAGGLEGPPISGALAARQRREAGALQVAGDANRRAELLERRQNALNRYRTPADVHLHVFASATWLGVGTTWFGPGRSGWPYEGYGKCQITM